MSIDLSNPNNEVQVREEFGTTQHRLYSSTTLFCEVVADAGPDPDWQLFSISFPIEISLYAASTLINSSMEGDETELHIGDETTVGAATQAVSIGDTVIHVSSVAYFKVGYWAYLDDATNRDELGMVTEIDPDASTIKVSVAAQHAFAPATPAKIQVKMGHSLKFAGSGGVSFGTAMIGGSTIPANTNIHVHYKNNQGDAKNLMLLLEYRY
jgi:hypothetical protein